MTEVVAWADLTMRDKENINSHNNEVHCFKFNSKKQVRERTRVLGVHERSVVPENESRTNPSERTARSVQTIPSNAPSVRTARGSVAEIRDNDVGPEEDAELSCAAAGLNYCERCDRGPVCCVYLNNEPQGGGCSAPRHLEAAGASGEGGDGETDSCQRREESDDSDETSVINFYLGQSNSQEGTVVEYEFFVDDDDEVDNDYCNLRYCGEDEDNDGYEDEDGDNDGENCEDLIDFEYNEHDFEDEEESCVDDVTEDMEAGHWSRNLLGPIRSRRSISDKFSRFQEPLEVILEMLGEEGDDESSTVVGTEINKRDDPDINNGDDLMNFSSSEEYSPDSIEEYRLRKYKSSPENLHRISSSEDWLSIPGSVQETMTLQEGRSLQDARSLQDVRTLQEARTLQETQSLHETKPANEAQMPQQDAVDCKMTPRLDVHTLPVNNIQQSPVVTHKTGDVSKQSTEPSLPGPSGKEEDGDKLRSLTSEIEAYLRETTMLLESTNSYASKTASRGTKTSEQQPKEDPNKKINRSLISMEVNDSRLRELQSVKSQSPNICNGISTPCNVWPSTLETLSATPNVSDAALDLDNELSCLITSVQKQKLVETEATRSLHPSPDDKNPTLSSLTAKTSKTATVQSKSSLIGWDDKIKPTASTQAEAKHTETMNCHESSQNNHNPSKNSNETTMNSHASPKNIHANAMSSHKPAVSSRVSFQSVSCITEGITTSKEVSQAPKVSEMKNDISEAYTKEFLEMDNMTESGHSSVRPTPTTEVLICMQACKGTTENGVTKTICKPQEMQQSSDCHFTRKNGVRRDWLATFKDLEESFDAAIKSNLPDVIKNDVLGVRQHDHPGVLHIVQSTVIQNVHSGRLKNNHPSVMQKDYSCVSHNDIPDVAKYDQSGVDDKDLTGIAKIDQPDVAKGNSKGVTEGDQSSVTKDDCLGVSKYNLPGNEPNKSDTFMKKSPLSVQSLSQTSVRNSSSSVQSDVQKTAFANTNILHPEVSPLGIEENPVRRRTRSRCQSPPPTVTCLEHLEKLCNRLSLEREQFTSEMLESEELSSKGRTEHKSRTEDEERKQTVKGEKLLETSSVSKVFLHGSGDRNTETNQRKSRPSMGVQHLQKNVARFQKQLDITPNAGDRSGLFLPLNRIVYEDKSKSRENGHSPCVKENEETKCAVLGETNELSKANYINTKIDEIFSCIESDASLSAPTNGTEILIPTKVYPHNMTFETECEEKKNLQVQLNNILGDLDLMYEKHQEKYTQASPPKLTNLPQLCSENITPPQPSREKGPCENAAFQDIINISEDLKHLCAFHIGRPATEGSSEHARAEGQTQDDFPGIFSTDCVPPGAVAKKPLQDKAFPGSEEHRVWATEDPKTWVTTSPLLHPASSRQEIRSGNINLLEGLSGCRGKTELPTGGNLSAIYLFLSKLREENLRCYQVTLRCLVKIIALTQVDLNVNIKAPPPTKADHLVQTDSQVGVNVHLRIPLTCKVTVGVPPAGQRTLALIIFSSWGSR
nr:uncharacterized protein LOC123773573 [Procambarus clarkii]